MQIWYPTSLFLSISFPLFSPLFPLFSLRFHYKKALHRCELLQRFSWTIQAFSNLHHCQAWLLFCFFWLERYGQWMHKLILKFPSLIGRQRGNHGEEMKHMPVWKTLSWLKTKSEMGHNPPPTCFGMCVPACKSRHHVHLGTFYIAGLWPFGLI